MSEGNSVEVSTSFDTLPLALVILFIFTWGDPDIMDVIISYFTNPTLIISIMR